MQLTYPNLTTDIFGHDIVNFTNAKGTLKANGTVYFSNFNPTWS